MLRLAADTTAGMCCDVPSAGKACMSFRNGDRSRENRLRRARILRRLKTSKLRKHLASAATPAKTAE